MLTAKATLSHKGKLTILFSDGITKIIEFRLKHKDGAANRASIHTAMYRLIAQCSGEYYQAANRTIPSILAQARTFSHKYEDEEKEKEKARDVQMNRAKKPPEVRATISRNGRITVICGNTSKSVLVQLKPGDEDGNELAVRNAMDSVISQFDGVRQLLIRNVTDSIVQQAKGLTRSKMLSKSDEDNSDS